MRSTESKNCRAVANEHGFTLIETAVAMMIMMIAGLGVLSLFTYSIDYNSGGNDRAVAISIAQQQIEQNNDASGNPTLKTITIRVDPTSSGWAGLPVILRTIRSATSKGTY